MAVAKFRPRLKSNCSGDIAPAHPVGTGNRPVPTFGIVRVLLLHTFSVGFRSYVVLVAGATDENMLGISNFGLASRPVTTIIRRVTSVNVAASGHIDDTQFLKVSGYSQTFVGQSHSLFFGESFTFCRRSPNFA